MTDFFSAWCDRSDDVSIGDHTVRLFTSNDDAVGLEAVVALLPQAYATTKNLESIAKRHGKEGVAKLLAGKTPATDRGRSGDLGEVLATEYVGSTLHYSTGPSRLIQRDHQEWALRGDDVLGARFRGNIVEFVKVEAKSRVIARRSAVQEAREGLQRNCNLASPHSLTQFAERLLETDEALGQAINDILQDDGLHPEDLTHVMFIFTGDDSKVREAINEDLQNYVGKVRQSTVTVRARDHKTFVASSYDRVVNHVP